MGMATGGSAEDTLATLILQGIRSFEEETGVAVGRDAVSLLISTLLPQANELLSQAKPEQLVAQIVVLLKAAPAEERIDLDEPSPFFEETAGIGFQSVQRYVTAETLSSIKWPWPFGPA
jgi:hypothetical protein